MELKLLNHNCCLIYSVSKRNENLVRYELAWVWHGYQLAEQIVKIDEGTTWQSAGTGWLTTANTGYDLGVKKNGYDLPRVRLCTGTT